MDGFFAGKKRVSIELECGCSMMKVYIQRIVILYISFQAFVATNCVACEQTECLALTVKQAFEWSESSALALPSNVSRVALANRFIDQQGQLNPSLNPLVKLLIAPDGMDNLGGYIEPQSKFNLYNFTHWSQIDVLSWFGGTADKTLLIPAKPWVNAAHKNGVKVIGSIFLAVSMWGGNPDTVEAFLTRDEQGRFPMAHQLVDIAKYYGFDGWLMNQETDLSAMKDTENNLLEGSKDYNRAAHLGREMLAFMQYLTHIAPAGMEIHWYDAQILDGTVVWQNELNATNGMFFGNRRAPASDAIFLNYWWDRSMVQSSHDYAVKLGRNPYDVYTGADLWPQRTAQRAFSQASWLDDIFSDTKKQGLTSVALFANNVNYSFLGDSETPAYSKFKLEPSDYQRFFDTETRLFAGDDLNMAYHKNDQWKGLSRYMPARSVIDSLPFETFFNVGQGIKRAYAGKVTVQGNWHNIDEQDLLPSWQFAVIGNANIKVKYDFTLPYEGGSSLGIEGDIGDGGVEIPLFKTALTVEQNRLHVIYRANTERAGALQLRFTDGSFEHYSLNTKSNHGWQSIVFDLSSHNKKTLQRISYVNATQTNSLALNIGALKIE